MQLMEAHSTSSAYKPHTVIPAKAGIHVEFDCALKPKMDSRFRGNDGGGRMVLTLIPLPRVWLEHKLG
jgi:hypothetical protein